MILRSVPSQFDLQAALLRPENPHRSRRSPRIREAVLPHNRRRRRRRRVEVRVRSSLDGFLQDIVVGFPSLDLLFTPAIGFAAGAAFYFSSLRRGKPCDVDAVVGDWVLFTSPTPFNRSVLLRCPSVSFEDGGELLEGVNESLLRDERHYVNLSRGGIPFAREEEGEEGPEQEISYQRACVGTDDGGVISLDWPENLDLGKEDGLDTTVLIVPGTAEGSMDRYVRSFVSDALQHGYFPIVMNPRGCAGSPLTTPRLFTAADSDDVLTALQFISTVRPWTTVMGVGWGYGANMLTKYLAEVGESTVLTAAVCVDNPFDLAEATRSFPHHIALDQKLMSGLIDILQDNKWIAAVEFTLLKGRHPLSKDVDVTINPSKGLAFIDERSLEQNISNGVKGRYNSSPLHLSQRIVDGYINRKLTQPNSVNGLLDDPANSVLKQTDAAAQGKVNGNVDSRSELQKIENEDDDGTKYINAIDFKNSSADTEMDEENKVLQTAAVVMNMLDVTMPGALDDEQKKKVLSTVGQGENLVRALQGAVPEDVRGKLTTAVTEIMQTQGKNLDLEGLNRIGWIPNVTSKVKSKIQDTMKISVNKNGHDENNSGVGHEGRVQGDLEQLNSVNISISESVEPSEQRTQTPGLIDDGCEPSQGNSMERVDHVIDEIGGEKHKVSQRLGIADKHTEDDNFLNDASYIHYSEEKSTDHNKEQHMPISISNSEESLSSSVSVSDHQVVQKECYEFQKNEEKVNQELHQNSHSSTTSNEASHSSSKPPSLSVTQALDALTGFDDSTQMAVNSVFGVLENMIDQLEKSNNEGDDAELKKSKDEVSQILSPDLPTVNGDDYRRTEQRSTRSIDRRLSTSNLKELEGDLVDDMKQVADAVTKAIVLDNHLDLKSLSEDSHLKMVNGTLDGERTVKIISSAIEETRYLKKILPVGLIAGSLLASLRKYFKIAALHYVDQNKDIENSGNIQEKHSMEEVYTRNEHLDDEKNQVYNDLTGGDRNSSTTNYSKERVMKLIVGGRLSEKSTVGGRLSEKSTVGIRLRKNKGKRRGKEKKKKRGIKNTSPASSSPACRRRPRVARGRDRGRFFSRARRRSVSPREETDRGDLKDTYKSSQVMEVPSKHDIGDISSCRVLWFGCMVLVLWSPVVFPLLPTLVQSWTTRTSNKIAEYACVLGLHVSSMILVVLWGKRIRGYDNPLEQYGLDLTAPRV
ncbi:hypothetical protein BHE74_00011857 [Ensete ventricosum]|nr:hypothetical protein BHE74_00011857 [Ensete ventricosum]